MALWTPADLPDLLSWVDPNDSSRITLKASGRLETYADKGSAGGDWTTNANASRGPQFTTVNGLQAFSAVDRTLAAADSLLSPSTLNSAFSGANTVAVVAFYSNLTNFVHSAAGTTTTGTSRVYGSLIDSTIANDPRRYRHGTTTTSASNTSGASTATDLAVMTRTGTAISRFTNGAADGTASNGANVSMATGGYAVVGVSGVNFGFEGWVGDHIICSSVLSTDDRQKLEGYLAHKWGQTAVLPGDHPYKTDPPETGGASYAITGAATASATATGSILASRPLSGIAAVLAIATGAIRASRPITGAATVSAAAAGAIGRSTPIVGDAAGAGIAAGAIGEIGADKPLDGAAMAAASAVGAIQASRPVVGQASATATATGVLGAARSVVGAAVVTATATGNLEIEGAPPDPAGSDWVLRRRRRRSVR